MTVITATDESFDKLLCSAEYTVVDFFGDHCGACVFLEPHYHAAAREFPFIQFLEVNTTHNPEIRRRYGITGIPALKFFRNGVEAHEAGGGMELDVLKQHIAKMLYD